MCSMFNCQDLPYIKGGFSLALVNGRRFVLIFAVFVSCILSSVSNANPRVNITRDTSLKRLKDSCLLPNGYRQQECCFTADDWEILATENSLIRSAASRCDFDAISESFPCSISLGLNNWVGTFATAYTAKIFIEEYLGWPVEIQAESPTDGVEPTQHIVDEDSGEIKQLSQWGRLSNGEIDAVLEVWLSANRHNVDEYVKKRGTVKTAGQLGIEGKIGWYFPSSLLDTTLSQGIIGAPDYLEYWKSLRYNAHIFKDTESMRPCCPSQYSSLVNTSRVCMPAEIPFGGTPVSQGGLNDTFECDKNPNLMIPTSFGGRFLSGSPGWLPLDPAIIKNLGLNFTVQFAQTEENLVREINQAIEYKDSALLFYFWRPHGLFSKLNLTRILLPPFTPECYANGDLTQYDCDYQTDFITKLYSSRLTEAFPDVVDFIHAFKFESGADQEDIMGSYLYGDVQNWYHVTCDWLRKDIRRGNESTVLKWKSLVDQKYEGQVWKNKEPTVEHFVCECGLENSMDIVAYFSFKDPLPGVIFDSDFGNICILKDSHIGRYWTRWTRIEYKSFVVEKVDCPYVLVGSKKGIVIITVVVFTNVLVLVLSFCVWIYRDSQIMKASRVRTMAVFLTGSFFLNLSAVVHIGSPPSVATCFFRTFFLTFGTESMISSLRMETRLLNHQLLLTSITPTLLVICWGLIPGYVPKSIEVGYGIEVDECPSNDVLSGIYVMLCLGCLLLGCAVSYFTRNIPGLYSVAKYIMITCYNSFVVFAATGILVLTVEMTFSEKELLLSLGVCWVTGSAVLLIAGTRTYGAMMRIQYQVQMDVVTGAMSTVQSRSNMSAKTGSSSRLNNTDMKQLAGT